MKRLKRILRSLWEELFWFYYLPKSFNNFVDENYSWKVVADHPILARPDKYRLSEIEAKDYTDSLVSLGYENITITNEYKR